MIFTSRHCCWTFRALPRRHRRIGRSRSRCSDPKRSSGVALITDTRSIQNPSEQASVVDELIANVATTLFIVSAERWPTDRGVATVRVTSPSRNEQRQLWRAALNGGAQPIESEIDAIVQ